MGEYDSSAEPGHDWRIVNMLKNKTETEVSLEH